MKNITINAMIAQLQRENDELELEKSNWEKKMNAAAERFGGASKEYTFASITYEQLTDNQYHRVLAIRELRHLTDLKDLG